MPSNATRYRIDWCPGDAAIEALEAGEALFPMLNRQSVIDRLLITGLAAYIGPHWHPPVFVGTSRDRWRLPASLLPEGGIPVIQRMSHAQRANFPGIERTVVLATVQCDSKEHEHG